MDLQNSVELKPIYVRISSNSDPMVASHLSDDEEYEQSPSSPRVYDLHEEPIAPPKRNWRRCIFGVLVFFAVFWLTSVLVSGYLVYSSAKTCVHPPHHRVTSLTFSPEQISGLDLFAVAGTISIHSCPFAKNISLHVSEGAGSEKLLEHMKTQHSIKKKVLHLFSTGPSFSWNNCQSSHINVVVPSSARLNLTAQTVAGQISLFAKANFDRIELGTSFGIIKAHHVKALHSFVARALVGYVSLHEVHANTTHVDVQTGIANVHDLKANHTCVEVRAGFARLKEIESSHSLLMAVDLGYACAKEIGSSKTIQAVVEYGFLRLQPTEESCYAFLMETNYGQLNVVNHVNEHHSKISLAKTSGDAKKSGVVGKDKPHSNIFVSTSYGHVTLVTESPITWNPDH